MDVSFSHRLALPLLHAGQAQKEMFHNEALALLDCVVQPVVQSIGDAAPPSDPVVGECHVVGGGASGAWVAKDDHLAGWTAGGWRFVQPFDGFHVWLAPEGVWATYRDSGWRVGTVFARALEVDGKRVVGPRGNGIAAPSGGAVIDAEARAALVALTDRLVAHGLIAESLV